MEEKQRKILIVLLIIPTILTIMFLVGVIFNVIAVSSNGGKMPVKRNLMNVQYPEEMYNPTHFFFHSYEKEEINNYWLTDIYTNKLIIKGYIFSIGDYFIVASFFLAPLGFFALLWALFIIAKEN